MIGLTLKTGVAALCATRGVQPRGLDFSDLKPALLAPPQHLSIRGDTEWVAPVRNRPSSS